MTSLASAHLGMKNTSVCKIQCWQGTCTILHELRTGSNRKAGIHIRKVLTYWQKRMCQSAHRCAWVWTYNLMNRDLTAKPVCTLSPKTLLAFMFLSHELCAVCHNSLQSNLTVQNTLHNLSYLLCNFLRKRNARRSHKSVVKHMYGAEEGTSSLWTIKIKVSGSDVYWTVHHDSWRIKNQLDVNCYIYFFLKYSACFGH